MLNLTPFALMNLPCALNDLLDSCTCPAPLRIIVVWCPSQGSSQSIRSAEGATEAKAESEEDEKQLNTWTRQLCF